VKQKEKKIWLYDSKRVTKCWHVGVSRGGSVRAKNKTKQKTSLIKSLWWSHGLPLKTRYKSRIMELTFTLGSTYRPFLSLSLSLSPTYIVFAPSLLYTYHANLLPPFIWVWRRSVLLPQAQISLRVWTSKLWCCFMLFCLFVFWGCSTKWKDLSCYVLHRVLSFFNFNVFCYLLHFRSNFVLFMYAKLIKTLVVYTHVYSSSNSSCLVLSKGFLFNILWNKKHLAKFFFQNFTKFNQIISLKAIYIYIYLFKFKFYY
jgi:hypothetical protein